MGQSGHSQPTATGTGASSGFRLSKEPVIPRKKETAGAASPPDYPASYAAYEELGSLPPGYGSRSLYLVARDPHWLFCYWDIDWTEYEAHRQAGGKVHLRLFTPVGEEVHCEEITPDARNWFIPVARGNSVFYGELGFYDAEGQWEVIARSPHAATPPDSVSEPSEDLFATVPYHLAFQKLLELVKTAMSEGESLIDALARIQNEGRRLMTALEHTPCWDDHQRRILATLLGHDVETLMQLPAPEVDRMLRGELSRVLAGERGSKTGDFPLLAPEENLSSWLAEWPHEAAGASGTSSWLHSWGAHLSGASEWGSSWSAQPFGASRGFFLNVNAEVIFHGGTEPGARLWIDGQPVPLDPEGKFRFHFRFDDGGREIPIVAESPDGKERRSATLHFDRKTAVSGSVEAAPAQGEPLGSAAFGTA